MLVRVRLIIALTYLSTLHVGASLGCKTPLWGVNCYNKCNCRNQTCAPDGNCTTGPHDCLRDWFGPFCQYADFASILRGSTTSWATDGNLDTCSPAANQKSDLSISLSMALTFTWVKLFVHSSAQAKIQAGTLPLPELYFDNKKDRKCQNQTVYSESDGFLVECHLTSLAESICIVGGEVTANLCEVKVNGGRNVALNRQANQTGTHSERGEPLLADKAVDGLVHDGNMFQCARDANRNPLHKFWLFLDKPAVIHTVRIINSNDSIDRLNGFVLELFDSGRSLIHTYKLPANVVNRTEYAVTFPLTSNQTSWLTIECFFDFFAICEVEAFANIVCPIGTWGLNCENSCQCQNSSCFYVTGACIYEAKLLPTVCAVGTYGEQCDQKCASCGSQGCDQVTGHCKSCPAGAHGSSCQYKCPENCRNQICRMATGTCVACLDNHSGDRCESATTPTDDSLLPLVVTCCVLVITLLFICIFCFLRRSKKLAVLKAEE